MGTERGEWGLQTRLIHAPEEANDTLAVAPPVYQTSTFRLSTPEEGAELAAQVAPAAYYTRYGNPSSREVEVLLAGLEGAEAALAVGSGMAAITTALMSNLGAGDHVVAQNTHYTATLILLAEVLPRHGVEVHAGRSDGHRGVRAGDEAEHQGDLHRNPDEPHHGPHGPFGHGRDRP